MRILNKEGFKLPYLGTDRFKELTRIGLSYKRGSFFIRDLNNIEKIKDALSNILNEEVVFTQTCLICGKEFLCTECKYYSSCPSRDLPFPCVCKNCSQNNDLYERYVEKDKRRMKHMHGSLS